MAGSEPRNPAADGPQPEPGVGRKARSGVEPKGRPGAELPARSGLDPHAGPGAAPQARPDVEPAASPDEEPAARPSVGERLKEARVAQDLSVEQLAAELRIEAQQLFALEQNRFERIGVPVFVKGYIKQYGARLGLDTSDLLATYYQQGKLADIDIRPSRSISFRDEQRTRGWVVALLVLLAIAVGLAIWWFNGGLVVPSLPIERSEPAAAPAAGKPAPSPRASEAGAGSAARVDAGALPPDPAPSVEPEPASQNGAPAVTPTATSSGTPPAGAAAAAPLHVDEE